jgi:TRAP-type C4-dicarboxylate transport system permease small subunit
MSKASDNKSQVRRRKPEITVGGVLDKLDPRLALVNRIMVYIAAIGLFGMMAITVIDVVGRYVFNKPLMGAYELVGYLMAIAGPWAIGYSQIQKGHIRVDFILKRLPARVQAGISSLAYLIGAFVFSVLCWRMVVLAQYYLGLKHGNLTDTMRIPIAPFVIIVAIGLGMLALVLLFDLVRSAAEVKKK